MSYDVCHDDDEDDEDEVTVEEYEASKRRVMCSNLLFSYRRLVEEGITHGACFNIGMLNEIETSIEQAEDHIISLMTGDSTHKAQGE